MPRNTKTPASVPVDQDVTLAVTSVRVSVLGLGVVRGSWGPSPGQHNVASKSLVSSPAAGRHQGWGQAGPDVSVQPDQSPQAGSHAPNLSAWVSRHASPRPRDKPAPSTPDARVARVRVANAFVGHQAPVAARLCGRSNIPRGWARRRNPRTRGRGSRFPGAVAGPCP